MVPLDAVAAIPERPEGTGASLRKCCGAAPCGVVLMHQVRPTPKKYIDAKGLADRGIWQGRGSRFRGTLSFQTTPRKDTGAIYPNRFAMPKPKVALRTASMTLNGKLGIELGGNAFSTVIASGGVQENFGRRSSI